MPHEGPTQEVGELTGIWGRLAWLCQDQSFDLKVLLLCIEQEPSS